MTLFNDEDFHHKHIDKKCNSCIFRERWAMGLSTIQYCAAKASNKTKYRLTKIKASDTACPKYIHSTTKPKIKYGKR